MELQVVKVLASRKTLLPFLLQPVAAGRLAYLAVLAVMALLTAMAAEEAQHLLRQMQAQAVTVQYPVVPVAGVAPV
jgi:hypothetical protein